MSQSDIERAVLAAYKVECDKDPDGAFAPVWGSIAAAHPAADARAVLEVCKALKKRGLLDGEVGRGAHAIITSTFWITPKGEEALR